MKANIRFTALTLAASLALAGCDSAKEELGLTRSSPDEFAVLKQAPLAMPPDFTLRPPAPGMPRPQEMSMTDQAKSTVLGANAPAAAAAPTQGENALLNQAGAISNPEIRRTVDIEAAQTAEKNQPVVKKLLSIGSDQLPPAKVVDPAAESERIKKNTAEGKPVTEGETPSIEE